VIEFGLKAAGIFTIDDVDLFSFVAGTLLHLAGPGKWKEAGLSILTIPGLPSRFWENAATRGQRHPLFICRVQDNGW